MLTVQINPSHCLLAMLLSLNASNVEQHKNSDYSISITKNIWMTGIIFKQFLLQSNSHVRHPILLLVNNASCHTWDDIIILNLDILPLPLNTTSKYQPLNTGIITA
jgi:hypothetical protein